MSGSDRAPPVEPGAGETVLIIEDEPVVRMIAVEVLQESGYQVLDAGDGHAGLRILNSTVRVDLLITDIGLPGGLNGRQVADAARLTRPQLKVLFITGYSKHEVIGNGIVAPGTAVITKPFEMAALAIKVRLMLDSAA